jgi:hypothetical protein
LKEGSLGEAFVLLGVVLVVLGISRHFDARQRRRNRLELWQREQALWQAIRQAAAVDAAEHKRERLERERKQVRSAAVRKATEREMRQQPRPAPPLSTWN